MKRVLLMLCAAVPFAAAAFAQSVVMNNPGVKGVFAIRGARIVPVSAPPIERGTVVIADGRIAAVGANVTVPAGAKVIDGSGLHVYPGLIDSGTNVGLTEINSVRGSLDINELGEINPNARAEVAINPHSNLIPTTRINGITALITMPEGGLVSGQDALIQLAGWTPPEMVIKAPVALHVNFPRGRGASIDEEEEEERKEADKKYEESVKKLRKLFEDARAYSKARRARATARDLPPFERDVVLEGMLPVIDGETPVVIHADRERDLRAAIRFAEEMELKVILSGAVDVRSVLPQLKEKNIPVILGPILSLPPREDDPYDLVFTNALALHEAGVKFAIQSGENHNSRNLPYHAAACAAFGLPKEEALKAVTLYPAEIFGVADHLGSLEVGKTANVLVTDGDPLEITTNVKHLFIGGEEIPIESHQTLLYEKFRNRPAPAQ